MLVNLVVVQLLVCMVVCMWLFACGCLHVDVCMWMFACGCLHVNCSTIV